MAIQNMFARQIDSKNFDAWQSSAYNTYTAVDISNRYFTYRNDDPYAQPVPLGPAVDPLGVLGALADHDLFHGEDNTVSYHRKPVGSTK